MPAESRYPQLVSIACHDLRTPLATVYGFARTLGRQELEEPAGRYVEMIEAASGQIADLLDQLSLVTRIETGGYEPRLEDVDSLELAQEAVAELGEERVRLSGEGATVQVEPPAARRALANLVRAAARHGGLDSVDLTVRGGELELSPLTDSSRVVLLGDDLRELGAATAGIVIGALGGSLEVAGDSLLIRLPLPQS